jgi:hypothetical protein
MRDLSVSLSNVHPKEASPGSAIHPLTHRCRARGGACRVFVLVRHVTAAGRADLEPVSLANVRSTLAARSVTRTDTDQVAFVEAVAADRLPQHPCRRSSPSRADLGVALAVSRTRVCTSGYASGARMSRMREKSDVYARYGVTWVPYAHEVDHLISLELGGSNAIRNLWPEPYAGRWGARTKDVLENRLHDLVCEGRLALRSAQRQEAWDWVAAYRSRGIAAVRWLGAILARRLLRVDLSDRVHDLLRA